MIHKKTSSIDFWDPKQKTTPKSNWHGYFVCKKQYITKSAKPVYIANSVN